MSGDRIVEELEKVRETLYREQPMTMDAVEQIINLLQYIHCPHVWQSQRTPDTADEPSETIVTCTKCGAERVED